MLSGRRPSAEPPLESSADRQPPESVPMRVWRGTAWQVLGRVWSAACTLTTLWLTAGLLSADAFGRLTFYLALFIWLDSLVNLGTGQVAVQRTAADPDALPSVLRTGRRIRVTTGVLGVLLVGGGAFAFGEAGAAWILLATLYPITHALELSTVVFRNRIVWGVPVAIRAIAAGASLAAVVTLWALGDQEPARYVLAVAVGSTLGNVLLHRAARPHLPPVPASTPPAPGFLRAALPLGISALAAQTYFYVDNVFIRVYRGEEELGPYNVAVRLMSLSIMVAQYASLASLPWLTRRAAAGELRAAVGRIGPVLFAAAGLGTGLVWPWAEELLELFKPGFAVAGDALRWLLLSAAAVYVGATLLTAAVAAGRTRAVLAISVVGLAVNLVGNFWWVPLEGIEGAAATTFVTEVVVALGGALVLARSGAALTGAGGGWRWFLGPFAFCLGLGLSWAVAAS